MKEHQMLRTSIWCNIHSQLLMYLAGIYKTHKWPVIPLVLYHGKQKWNISTNFMSSLEIPEELRNPLIKYIPEFQYILLDLSSGKMALAIFLSLYRPFW